MPCGATEVIILWELLRIILIGDRMHFYHDHRSLNMPKNNTLVLLAFSPIDSAVGKELTEWTASVDSRSLYERIIKDMQDPQSKSNSF